METSRSKFQYENDYERVVIVSKELERHLLALLREINPDTNYDYKYRLKNLIDRASPYFSNDITTLMQQLGECRNRILHEHSYDELDNRTRFDNGFHLVYVALKQAAPRMEISPITSSSRSGWDMKHVVSRCKELEYQLRQALNLNSEHYGKALIKKTNAIASFPTQIMNEMNMLRNQIVHDYNKNSLTLMERRKFNANDDAVQKAINELRRNQSSTTMIRHHNLHAYRNMEVDDRNSEENSGLALFAFGFAAVATVATVAKMCHEYQKKKKEEEEKRRKQKMEEEKLKNTVAFVVFILCCIMYASCCAGVFYFCRFLYGKISSYVLPFLPEQGNQRTSDTIHHSNWDANNQMEADQLSQQENMGITWVQRAIRAFVATTFVATLSFYLIFGLIDSYIKYLKYEEEKRRRQSSWWG